MRNENVDKLNDFIDLQTSRIVKKEYEIRRLVNKENFVSLMTICTVSMISLVSWHLSQGESVNVINSGNNYLLFWFPFLASVCFLLFGVNIMHSFEQRSNLIKNDKTLYGILATVFFLIQLLGVMVFFVKPVADIFYNEYVYSGCQIFEIALSLLIVVRCLFRREY